MAHILFPLEEFDEHVYNKEDALALVKDGHHNLVSGFFIVLRNSKISQSLDFFNLPKNSKKI